MLPLVLRGQYLGLVQIFVVLRSDGAQTVASASSVRELIGWAAAGCSSAKPSELDRRVEVNWNPPEVGSIELGSEICPKDGSSRGLDSKGLDWFEEADSCSDEVLKVVASWDGDEAEMTRGESRSSRHE
jgi:hypothetical protein